MVCRGLDTALKQCGVPVGGVPPPADFANASKASGKKMTASFIDTLPYALAQEHATGRASYAVGVPNTAGRVAGLSNQVHVPLVPTVPPFGDFSASVVPQGVVISWRCNSIAGVETSEIGHLFRIYRREERSKSDAKITELGTVCLDGPRAGAAPVDLPVKEQRDFPGSFLDQNLEWERTYFYRGTVVSVVQVAGQPVMEVEGDDTPEVKIFAHDSFPPAVPGGLQAVFSGPGQRPFIDLVWTPVTDADLAGYNIYRREEGTSSFKVNAETAKTPAFRDTSVEPEKTYFYSVTAVDVRGNESARSEETSERVP